MHYIYILHYIKIIRKKTQYFSSCDYDYTYRQILNMLVLLTYFWKYAFECDQSCINGFLIVKMKLQNAKANLFFE